MRSFDRDTYTSPAAISTNHHVRSPPPTAIADDDVRMVKDLGHALNGEAMHGDLFLVFLVKQEADYGELDPGLLATYTL